MHVPIPLIAPEAHPSLDGLRTPALLHAIDALVAILVDPVAAPLSQSLGSLSYLSRIPSLVSLGARSIIIGVGNVLFLGGVLIDNEHRVQCQSEARLLGWELLMLLKVCPMRLSALKIPYIRCDNLTSGSCR